MRIGDLIKDRMVGAGKGFSFVPDVLAELTGAITTPLIRGVSSVVSTVASIGGGGLMYYEHLRSVRNSRDAVGDSAEYFPSAAKLVGSYIGNSVRGTERFLT